MNIVLTGPAYDNAGHAILRENLIHACKVKNLRVQGSVGPSTNLLIASRTDTAKAKKAQAHGLAVLTYPQFIGQYLHGVTIPTDGVPNKYADIVNPDLLVPDFVADDDL